MDRLLTDSEMEEVLQSMIMDAAINYSNNGSRNFYDDAKEMVALINTQKRLYADSVIGGDEAADYSYLPPTLDEMTKSAHEKAVRNQLRAEQRARIK